MSETRAFRSSESVDAEEGRRAALLPFLEGCGYTVLSDARQQRGTAQTQIIRAISPSGEAMTMRARLCWRRDGRSASEHLYSAAQLRASLKDDDWQATLDFIRQRDMDAGITHTLFVRDDRIGRVVQAALVPRDELKVIWERQRDVAESLIRNGRSGTVRANQAMNGQSPTVWLQDDRRPDSYLIADALWSSPSVVSLVREHDACATTTDDSLDDLITVSLPSGRDGAERTWRTVSGYPRDGAVRAEVIRRSGGMCERVECGTGRDYPGFLDVHHILGVGVSDRPWNCVAICPNCHREAHFAPGRDHLNRELHSYAVLASAGR